MSISNQRKQNWLSRQQLISTKFDKAYWRSNKGSIILKLNANDKSSEFEYPYDDWNSFVLQSQKEYRFMIHALLDDFEKKYPNEINNDVELSFVIRGKAQILKLVSSIREFRNSDYNTWIRLFEFYCASLLTYDLYNYYPDGDTVLIECDCKNIFSDIKLITLLPYDENDLKNIINQITVNKIDGFVVHNIEWNPDFLNF